MHARVQMDRGGADLVGVGLKIVRRARVRSQRERADCVHVARRTICACADGQGRG